MKNPAPPPCFMRYRLRGFTLIELLISLLITLFMIAGMHVVYSSLKNSFNTQDKLSQLQDNARLTLTLMTQTIQQAGYYIIGENGAFTAMPPFAAGQAINGVTNATGSDSLTVRYQTIKDDGLLDCTGEGSSSTASRIRYNTFTVNDAHELTCAYADDAIPTTNSVVLATNVHLLKVRYGVDLSAEADADGSMDTWLDANAIGNRQVGCVKLTIKFIDPAGDGSSAMPGNGLVHIINIMGAGNKAARKDTNNG